ncbi:2-dehydropantoate 2-reductase [Lachnospiraceae bacterium XBB1006]|nr:2-dehydropantoate 2-reductase [Lachnospiraceae bacterium XBB1006]
MNLQDKKIAVVGLGGVGGYIGALLANHYPHVTFVARGNRGESIKKNGLVLHSEYRGERVIHPEKVVSSGEELEIQDYIFVCVKTYSLEEALKSIEGAVDEHTVVIPVMNGADTGERARHLLNKGQVVDSLIYIITFANPDYSITQQGMYTIVWLGIDGATEKQQLILKEADALLQAAEIESRVAEDIHRQIWKKYIMNCAYNVETAAYDNTIGQLRDDPVKAKEYEALIHEAYDVAVAKGIAMRESDLDWLIRRFYEELSDGDTSSLQRDVEAHRQSEVDTFCGYLIREAKKNGVAVPVMERMETMILKRLS